MKYKYRNCALIILYDEDKKILLQQRTDDAPTRPGCWGFFGGGIEKDETPEQAVRRECFEELNYTLENPKFIAKKEDKGKTNQTHGLWHIFIEKCCDKNSLKLQEGQDMKWFSIDEAKKIRNLLQRHINVLNCIEYKI